MSVFSGLWHRLHLFILHHEGDAHAFEFSLFIQVVLALAGAQVGRYLVITPVHSPGRIDFFGTLKVPLAGFSGFLVPMRV